jgi:hypothetical protein
MQKQRFIINSHNFEAVIEFNYLGSLIKGKNDLEEEIKQNYNRK